MPFIKGFSYEAGDYRTDGKFNSTPMTGFVTKRFHLYPRILSCLEIARIYDKTYSCKMSSCFDDCLLCNVKGNTPFGGL